MNDIAHTLYNIVQYIGIWSHGNVAVGVIYSCSLFQSKTR